MSTLFASYILLTVITLIAVAIILENNDGGAA